MSEQQLFEQLDFQENPLYERIIDHIATQGYCVVDDFFNPWEIVQLREALLQLYEADQFKKSAIGNHFNELIAKSVRGDFILWLNESESGEAEKQFFFKINDLVAYLNKTCFMGIIQKEFHYAVYPEGTFYKRHLDTFQNDDRRKLSVVCYLNEASWNEANGGALVIYVPGENGEQALRITPLPGRMVIFESQKLEHEVEAVRSGERLSITGWLKTR